uniref:Uncharacterized protein n=1 Tax=Anguilla anguilla TaxID=7936 RepID=A0A0E9Q7R8_ANGAN
MAVLNRQGKRTQPDTGKQSHQK